MKFIIVTAVFAFGVFALYYWIYTLVKISKNEILESTEKVLWLLGVIFFPLFGTILYWIKDKNDSRSYRESEFVPDPL